MPEKIKLETKNGCSYIIKVARNQEQQLVLTTGWGPFVEKLSLQMGDTIIFRYKGNSQFNVMIFDRRGCEKALSVVDPFPPRALERRTGVAAETVNQHSSGHPPPVETPRTEAAADLLLLLREPMQTAEAMDCSSSSESLAGMRRVQNIFPPL